jgi:hypothetical protein
MRIFGQHKARIRVDPLHGGVQLTSIVGLLRNKESTNA